MTIYIIGQIWITCAHRVIAKPQRALNPPKSKLDTKVPCLCGSNQFHTCLQYKTWFIPSSNKVGLLRCERAGRWACRNNSAPSFSSHFSSSRVGDQRQNCEGVT